MVDHRALEEVGPRTAAPVGDPEQLGREQHRHARHVEPLAGFERLRDPSAPNVREHPTERPEAVVDDRAGVHREHDPRRERLRAAADLVLVPHVVLVAERDRVAAAPRRGGQEVVGEAERLLVDGEPHGEWTAPRELAHDVDGRVAGAVVAHDELHRSQRLPLDARELLAQVPLAVVGRERDGDGARVQLVEPRAIRRKSSSYCRATAATSYR